MKHNQILQTRIFFILTTLCLLVASLVLSAKGYTSYTMKYYDARTAQVDYRGYRTFKREIRNTMKYMRRGWDYYIVYFRPDGRLKNCKYLNNGNVIFEDRFFYKNKRLSKIRTYIGNKPLHTVYLGKNKYKVKKVYQYNKSYMISYFRKDKKVKRIEKYNRRNELLSASKISYSKSGKRHKLRYYDESNELIEYMKYSYRGGLKTKTASYDADDDLIGYTIYIYNRGKQLQKIVVYDSDEEVLGSSVYEYNDQGKVRYVLHYNKDGRLIVR